ncbi:tRNA1(Val) (adenine(37)-N6)-methyltransferase [Emticicia agri]|uniref:tRNA1(Val) (adenine(37)-N6)-methyltransferase n=1 Tax=Emticicia agri TaxID=2492393 RepID=A0A4V1ZCU5_9BACT|nr:methyltransferase [Emticicia agri]RYU93880.1 methyltransferase domain-containing protein [Emticicia agri]
MPKSYFQFKQFIVHQDKCAMKVCTDACILGAYADVSAANKILDIGTGTGLLSLMLAQRSKATIDAVEIDNDAYTQAKINIAESPFAERITLHQQPVQQFSREQSGDVNPLYDLIISNPPFYQNSLPSPDAQTNKALHAETLTFSELIEVVVSLLAADGRFIVLLPPFEADQLTRVAQKKALYLSEKLLIQHNPQKAVFRVIMTFQKRSISEYREDTLAIHEKNSNTYADKFRQLLSDYYTIF